MFYYVISSLIILITVFILIFIPIGEAFHFRKDLLLLV